jgi:hypothetical protein
MDECLAIVSSKFAKRGHLKEMEWTPGSLIILSHLIEHVPLKTHGRLYP